MRLTLITKTTDGWRGDRITVDALYVDHKGTVAYKRDRFSAWEPLPEGAFYALEAYNDLQNERAQAKWEEKVLPSTALPGVRKAAS